MNVEAIAPSGLIVVTEERNGREWRSEILPGASVTLAEAAELCGVSRATVYRWVDAPVDKGYWREGAQLTADDGRVWMPELRRFLLARGKWWLRARPQAEALASAGPVAGQEEELERDETAPVSGASS